MSRYFASLERGGDARRSAPPPTAVEPVPRPVGVPRPQPDAAEYVVLHERLLARANGRLLRAIVFAGCGGGEACSRVVVDFAQSLAGAGLRVLVVDAHGRATATLPGMGAVDVDLAALVAAGRTPAASACGTGQLAVVPARMPVGEKERLFTQPSFAAWLAAQRAAFDYVLVDAPPLLRFADATMIGKHVDGVILVVEAEVTERRALVRARAQLTHAGVPVIGVVLNNVRRHVPALLERFLPGE
jgi:polysaccharide biosynthesis transport protein